MYPSSSPPGSLIELVGYLSGSIHTYERLYMGDLQCDHIDSTTGLPYGLRWYLSKRHAECKLQGQAVGAYNASVQFRDWGNTYGTSWNHSAAMYLMPDGSLGMFEVFPGQSALYVYTLQLQNTKLFYYKLVSQLHFSFLFNGTQGRNTVNCMVC